MTARPPLWTWLAALVIAVVLLAGLAAWARLVDDPADPPEPLSYYRTERLQRVSPTDAVVVAIGSSLTRCAFEHDSAMSALLRARAPGGRFVRMTSNSLTADRSRPLWRPILAARPRLLVIEGNLVRYGRVPTGKWWLHNWRVGVRSAISDLFRQRRAAVVPRSDENGDGTDDRCWRFRRMTPGAAYQGMLSRWRPSDDDDLGALITFVQTAEASGIRVLVFDLPRNPRYATSFPVELERAGDRQLATLLAHTRAEHVTRFPPLPPVLYADAGHLRPAGQKIVSAFMAARIAAAIGRP